MWIDELKLEDYSIL